MQLKEEGKYKSYYNCLKQSTFFHLNVKQEHPTRRYFTPNIWLATFYSINTLQSFEIVWQSKAKYDEAESW